MREAAQREAAQREEAARREAQLRARRAREEMTPAQRASLLQRAGLWNAWLG